MDAPFGLWPSPITEALATSASVSFQDLVVDHDTLYWSEMRPAESGRYAIVRYAEDRVETVLPEPFNARTRVHEYGGAAFRVHQSTIYFVNFADQRIYFFKVGQQPTALTAPGIRFAELHITPHGIVAIAETHQDDQVDNSIVLISLQDGSVKTLASGYDFYSQIALSADYRKIAWTCWNHPNMPWDDTELWIADFNASISNAYRIDESFTNQSFFAPKFHSSHQLYVVSDKSNWWNLYRVEGRELKALFAVDSEIGRPLWTFGESTWDFYEDGLICTFAQQGKGKLFYYHGELQEIASDYRGFSQVHAGKNIAGMIANAPDKPSAILLLKDRKLSVIHQSTQLKIDPDYLSKPEHITFPSENRQSHAFYYPPKNKEARGLPGTLPPLIVRSHGGPTANCGSALNLDIQYWTSRGFAYVDVNYAGSTGYGRDYRKLLEKNWGIYDIQDCVAAANYLIEQDKANPKQLAITGGSAGGYTTLAALTFTDTFHVGASLYGVSELEALVKDTHKFESRYLDRLIGPYPQQKQVYWDRSPLNHVERLSSPVIFFQGQEDKIVLPNQAEMMIQALQEKGIKTAYYLFEGEQHGFRKAENRMTVLKEQYRFFIEVLGIHPG